jgi:hypothetical protein
MYNIGTNGILYTSVNVIQSVVGKDLVELEKYFEKKNRSS